jgi:uncharacterized membrane protein YqhA
MFEKLLNIRYLFGIAVVFMLINSMFFLVSGAVHCIHGYAVYVENGLLPNQESRPGLHLVEGLDSFMVSLVFLVFGLGIARLFVFNNVKSEDLPTWLQFHDLKGLKVLLWETILVTLVIFCLSRIVTDDFQSWTSLILPGIILMLSAALFFMRGSESHH